MKEKKSGSNENKPKRANHSSLLARFHLAGPSIGQVDLLRCGVDVFLTHFGQNSFMEPPRRMRLLGHGHTWFWGDIDMLYFMDY
jgi:hypothetical protein